MLRAISVAIVLSTSYHGYGDGAGIVVFATYQDAFRFMASQNHLPTDDNSLFKLAADSSLSTYWVQEGSRDIVYVIKLDYISPPYSRIRGAQDNGLYYLFIPRTNGLEHVGTMEGCAFRWGTLNGRCRFITGWHMSASQSIDREYVWNGARFECTQSMLYQYGEDGEKTPLKNYLKETKTEPAGGAYVSPAAGDPSAHP